MFCGIDEAFTQVYGTAGEKSIAGELRGGELALPCIGVGVGVMGVVGGFPLGPVAGPAGGLPVFVSLVLVFLAASYVDVVRYGRLGGVLLPVSAVRTHSP